jgi:hypothetical protein
VDPLESARACFVSGGLYALVIPPVAFALLVIEFLWLIWVATRELRRRADLIHLRDLVIEGSLGQAILVADARSKDDLLAVCRTAIVAVQSNVPADEVMTRIEREATARYAGRGRARLRVVVLALLTLIPAGLAVASRAYAEGVLRQVAASVPADERSTMISEARMDPAFGCPVWLGFGSAIALALPAVLVGALESTRFSSRARLNAIMQAQFLADMSVRVLDPAHRVYQQERDRR